jgi:hypothetical protein
MFDTRAETSSSSRKNASQLFVGREYRENLISVLKGAPLSVHLAYQSFANREGLAWPSLRKLVKVSGYGINAVKEARRKLLSLGLLEPVEQEREGGRFGLKRFRVFTVARNPSHGTVAPSTVARCTVARKQCQEGSPSEGSPKEGDQVDAVRRRGDAELLRPDDDLGSKAKPKTSFEAKPNSVPRGAKLQSRISALIKRNDEPFSDWMDRELSKGHANPFGREEREAFAALGYQPNLRSADLSSDFVNAVCNVYEEHRGAGVSPGNLCSKVIDRLQRDRRFDRKQGGDGCGHFWPNDFQRHRDTLREQERRVEAVAKANTNDRRVSSGGAACAR